MFLAFQDVIDQQNADDFFITLVTIFHFAPINSQTLALRVCCGGGVGSNLFACRLADAANSRFDSEPVLPGSGMPKVVIM
jgi:hypothetical protein